jgi:hypothetical protein
VRQGLAADRPRPLFGRALVIGVIFIRAQLHGDKRAALHYASRRADLMLSLRARYKYS